MRILNYKFSFCLFFFAGVDIHLCNCSSSAFQAAMVGMSLSAGRIPAVMKVIAFQAKVSRRIENFDCDGYFCIRGCFLGLKSRIFITAEFILRHESSSETCLEGSTFIRHEGAKTRSRIFTFCRCGYHLCSY